jgi:hypothetical protein
MPSANSPYRGRVQAQGADIDIDQKGGYSESWARSEPVTDVEGLDFLAKIEGQCSKAQKKERESLFRRARRFVKNAGEQGGVPPEAQPHPFEDPKRRTIFDARVDIEIKTGITFVPINKPKGVTDCEYDLFLLVIAKLLHNQYSRLLDFYFHALIRQRQPK